MTSCFAGRRGCGLSGSGFERMAADPRDLPCFRGVLGSEFFMCFVNVVYEVCVCGDNLSERALKA